MAFEIRDLIFSIEPDDRGGARLQLYGRDEQTRAVIAAHEIDCGRTAPPPVRGIVPVNRLEVLRSALEDLEAQVNRELERRQGGS